jgi:hypothetical protein
MLLRLAHFSLANALHLKFCSQALFRPVAMMVPDYRLIAEVSLYANGYQSAANLAVNLVSALKVPSFYINGHM